MAPPTFNTTVDVSLSQRIAGQTLLSGRVGIMPPAPWPWLTHALLYALPGCVDSSTNSQDFVGYVPLCVVRTLSLTLLAARPPPPRMPPPPPPPPPPPSAGRRRAFDEGGHQHAIAFQEAAGTGESSASEDTTAIEDAAAVEGIGAAFKKIGAAIKKIGAAIKKIGAAASTNERPGRRVQSAFAPLPPPSRPPPSPPVPPISPPPRPPPPLPAAPFLYPRREMISAFDITLPFAFVTNNPLTWRRSV